ncbi:MAG: beta-N-acetylglucosaminidase domain-containing protein [Actinoallomurus sp.]
MYSSPLRRRPCAVVLLILAVLATCLAPPAASAATSRWTPAVTPAPHSLRLTGQDATVAGTAAVIIGPGSDPSATSEVTSLLRDAGATSVLSFATTATVPANVRLAVYVGGPAGDPATGPALKRLGVPGTDGLPAEGYVLASGRDAGRFDIVLAGVDAAGTFYAAQTLRQLVHRMGRRWHLPGAVVRDWPDLRGRGVIEGFYGPPWSDAERQAILRFEGEHKMDSYVYAPKDDPYHRDRWRDPYPADQLARLGTLARLARQEHVDFVFAVSPGQSICYSSDDDLRALEAKARSVYDLGVRSFALFFDDIAGTLTCASDQERFGTDPSPSAAAQAFLLNRFDHEFVAAHPGMAPLRTVPTEYNGLNPSDYKKRLAELVATDVHMYWTGPQVVSPTISDSDLTAARALYAHPLEVWDNYPVNDYQLDRLFMGPVTGRGTMMTADGVSGFVANPMLEAIASEPALATTADLTWNDAAYDPQRSWDQAVASVGGPASAALRTFAENNLSSKLGGTESPDLAPKIAAFEKDLTAGSAASAPALAAAFDGLAAAPGRIRTGVPDPGFAAEADRWLTKAGLYGVGGAAAVRSLAAQLAVSDDTAWRQRIVLDRAVEDATAVPRTVGAGVLDPFLTWAQGRSDRVTLESPAPADALQPGTDVTLRAAVRSGDIGIRSVRFYAGGTLIGETTTAPYQVVWHNVPRELAQITVSATDQTGATITSAPANLTIGTPDRALFIVNDADAMTPGDQAVVQRLNYLGLAVTSKSAAQAVAADADGTALVAVSSTISSSQLKDRFRDVPVPLVTWESYLYGYLGMAGSANEAFRSQQADFKSPASPLSGGVTGTVDVYRRPDSIRWGTPAPTAIVGATLPGSPGEAVLFGYEKGAQMVSAVAPARRVAIFLSDSGLETDLVTPQAVRAFDSSVSWALGRT